MAHHAGPILMWTALYYAPTGIKLSQPRATLISVILIGDLSWLKSIINGLKYWFLLGNIRPSGSTPLALKNFTFITITANQLITCRYHGIPCFRKNLEI